VESAAVVGAPDEKWGERVVAFVVTYLDKSVDVSDLVLHCRGLIAGYKVPKEIHLMDTLPHTASGKVQKRLCANNFRVDRGSKHDCFLGDNSWAISRYSKKTCSPARRS
jgi:acyl-CoA synthetase (AMP-forming)/AMP-acid ligase II